MSESYSIALQVYQHPDRGYFSIVEKTCWNFANGGTWSEDNGVLTLTMGGSGTSGVLRFKSDRDELLTVAVGVHNYKRWCDIVTGLPPSGTALLVNGQYYNGGPRAADREAQRVEQQVTSAAGTKVQVVYTVAEGHHLKANIILGP